MRARFLAQNRHRITTEGEFVISSQRYRDQPRNIADCHEKLQALLRAAAVRPARAKKTKPTAGSPTAPLADKRLRSATKQLRRREDEDEGRAAGRLHRILSSFRTLRSPPASYRIPLFTKFGFGPYYSDLARFDRRICPRMAVLLQLKNAHKSYGNQVLLDDAEVTLDRRREGRLRRPQRRRQEHAARASCSAKKSSTAAKSSGIPSCGWAICGSTIRFSRAKRRSTS